MTTQQQTKPPRRLTLWLIVLSSAAAAAVFGAFNERNAEASAAQQAQIEAAKTPAIKAREKADKDTAATQRTIALTKIQAFKNSLK